jgi:nitrate reductase beta subunit
VSGCPYKKVYFNWKTGRSEKCIFCYPRLEAGLTTLCSHSCVGRIRYVGVVLYDADRIHEAASARTDREVYPAHLDLFLDPSNPETIAAAKSQGIPDHVMTAARKSPIYPLVKTWQLALPLHPEFRTLPMVWYIPPLSPVEKLAENDDIRMAVDNLRIPVRYLANLLTAGDEEPVRKALKRLAAVRASMRSIRVEGKPDETIAESVGLDSQSILKMYDLLAIARLEDRFVIPTAFHPDRSPLHTVQGCTGFPECR